MTTATLVDFLCGLSNDLDDYLAPIPPGDRPVILLDMLDRLERKTDEIINTHLLPGREVLP